MSRLFTLTQAARRMFMSVATLRRMIRRAEFPAPMRRNARWIRVPAQDVEDYLRRLDEQRQQQPA